MEDFETLVESGVLILTDGGVETRVMFETEIELPPHVQAAALVDDPARSPALRGIFEGYVEAAGSRGLPVTIGTPTFRANPNFLRDAGPGGEEAARRLNHNSAALHQEVRAGSGHENALGCRVGAYPSAGNKKPRPRGRGKRSTLKVS